MTGNKTKHNEQESDEQRTTIDEAMVKERDEEVNALIRQLNGFDVSPRPHLVSLDNPNAVLPPSSSSVDFSSPLVSPPPKVFIALKPSTTTFALEPRVVPHARSLTSPPTVLPAPRALPPLRVQPSTPSDSRLQALYTARQARQQPSSISSTMSPPKSVMGKQFAAYQSLRAQIADDATVTITATPAPVMLSPPPPAPFSVSSMVVPLSTLPLTPVSLSSSSSSSSVSSVPPPVANVLSPVLLSPPPPSALRTRLMELRAQRQQTTTDET